VDFSANPLFVYLTETLNYAKHRLALERFSSPCQHVPCGPFSSGENVPSLTITTQLQLVLKVKKNGAIPQKEAKAHSTVNP